MMGVLWKVFIEPYEVRAHQYEKLLKGVLLAAVFCLICCSVAVYLLVPHQQILGVLYIGVHIIMYKI